jgi:4,5-DOPA dioxygenase extradiol
VNTTRGTAGIPAIHGGEEVNYPTPDAGALARRRAAAMPDTEPVHEHTGRGLDHGAWVPLNVMYPAAEIPVLQLSMPTMDPGRLLALGRRLRPLATRACW